VTNLVFVSILMVCFAQFAARVWFHDMGLIIHTCG